MRMPPSEGPRAVPIADIVPSRPIALPVLLFGTVSPTDAIASAIITAAPRPCAVLAAMSDHSVGAKPQRTEASGEQGDADEQQPSAAYQIAEASHADDQGGDGQEIGQHDPLDLLEGSANACAIVGKPTLAMLVPSDDSSMR